MLECMRAMKVLLSKLVVAHIQQNLLCWVSKHHISMPLIQWVGIIHCVLFKKSKTIFILAFFGKICASGPFCSDAIVLETSDSKISSPCSFYHQSNCLSWGPLLYKSYDLGATADPNSPCWHDLELAIFPLRSAIYGKISLKQIGVQQKVINN